MNIMLLLNEYNKVKLNEYNKDVFVTVIFVVDHHKMKDWSLRLFQAAAKE